MPRVLFVCSGNIDRSPTAERLLKGVRGVYVKSAGTLGSAPTALSKSLVQWADVIFAMQEEHKEIVKRIIHGAEKKVIVLGIEDTYKKDDPELIRILKEKLSKYFDLK
jgi:predicted protein tyrosine phosphatase